MTGNLSNTSLTKGNVHQFPPYLQCGQSAKTNLVLEALFMDMTLKQLTSQEGLLSVSLYTKWISQFKKVSALYDKN